MENKDELLVFVELSGGGLDETAKGLLSLGSRAAGIFGCGWSAAVCSEVDPAAAPLFGRYGIPVVHSLQGGVDNIFDYPALIGSLVARFMKTRGMRVVILPQNDLGSTIAPIIAAELDAAIVTEVIAIAKKDERIELSRHVLGKSIAETRAWNSKHPLVVTVPLASLSPVIPPHVAKTAPDVKMWRTDFLPFPATPVVTGRIPPDPETVDLSEAQIIFCAGKGCSREVFDMLERLCGRLKVSLGVTRPVYDLGWTGFERMIGQTGRTVMPALYVAFGVSGSVHHIGGIKDSRRIIAVNVDAKAPIFPNADEGFVADLEEVVPLLLHRIEATVEVAS